MRGNHVDHLLDNAHVTALEKALAQAAKAVLGPGAGYRSARGLGLFVEILPRGAKPAGIREARCGNLADDLRLRGLARARRFTWDQAARETVQCYERAVAG